LDSGVNKCIAKANQNKKGGLNLELCVDRWTSAWKPQSNSQHGTGCRSGSFGILSTPVGLNTSGSVIGRVGVMARYGDVLWIEPRGLNRVKSAAYVGVSSTLFDEMVRDCRMPQPKRINSRVVWDRKQLDEAFEALPDREDRNPWDEEDAA
jgi:predicted DNA-binding transcriptional regulator AlpA